VKPASVSATEAPCLVKTQPPFFRSPGSSRKYVFQPQYDTSIPEDQRFAKASPSGKFEIMVDNPAVHDQFKVGQAYYFDATPVPA